MSDSAMSPEVKDEVDTRSSLGRCDWADGLESAHPRECVEDATHLTPGTPLGGVALCDRHYAEYLEDDEGGVTSDSERIDGC